MALESLILIALGLLVLPLLGTVAGMAVGLANALRPHREVPMLITRARRVAASFGCYLVDELPAAAAGARGPDDARVTPDRRIGDRRVRARRGAARLGAERRRRDRRQRDRRICHTARLAR